MPALHETRKAVIEAMRLIMTDQEQRLAATHATLKELQGRAENQVRHEFAYTTLTGAAAPAPNRRLVSQRRTDGESGGLAMRRKGAKGSAAAPPLPSPAFCPPGAVSQKVLDRLFALADRSSGLQLGLTPQAAAASVCRWPSV
jgi:hypothetical protein